VLVRGRKVAGGKAAGKVALSTAALSFLGEIDPATGRIDNPSSELNGKSVSDQILAFPEARGSTVGPYVLYGARKRGVGPRAMLVTQADAIVASAAVIARLPCVDGIDMDLLVHGEEVTVDADEGTVDIPAVKEQHVVTALLRDPEGEILLLKRSAKVSTYQGKWAGVSGYLEGVPAREQALREVKEEVGLDPAQLGSPIEGPLVYVRQGTVGFVVHPVLLPVKHPRTRLNWENTEHAWVKPADLSKHETVPKLSKVWHVLDLAQRAATSAPAQG
jgi:uncharacterized protein